MSETITLSRREYDRLRQAERYWAAEYERKATEMRRKENQAHAQLEAATRDLDKLRLRVKELEGDDD